MNDFFRDLRHSLGRLRRSPGFTFTAVAALALGIAAVTAIFSLVNAVLLRPFPIRDEDRFVRLMNANALNYTGGDKPEQLSVLQASADMIRRTAPAWRSSVRSFGEPGSRPTRRCSAGTSN